MDMCLEQTRTVQDTFLKLCMSDIRIICYLFSHILYYLFCFQSISFFKWNYNISLDSIAKVFFVINFIRCLESGFGVIPTKIITFRPNDKPFVNNKLETRSDDVAKLEKSEIKLLI
jgi:hypothetical protein